MRVKRLERDGNEEAQEGVLAWTKRKAFVLSCEEWH